MTDTTVAPDPPSRISAIAGLYFNRELSWLQFNARVLELAEDPDVPLLERVKFCAITSSNLDEFFMVRVAGLHDQIDAGIETPLQDGRTPSADDRSGSARWCAGTSPARRGAWSTTCARRWPSTASGSSGSTTSRRRSSSSSTSASAARSSRC